MKADDADHRVVRLGNPWLSYGLFVFYMGAWAGMLVMGVSFILSGQPTDTQLRFGTLLAVVPATIGVGVFLVVALVVVISSPRTIGRVVILTPAELRMPRRKKGRIPLDDVAGVGLAMQRGAWGLMVWRSDGSHVYARGLQTKVKLAAPERARAGVGATEVYRYVLAHQGPAGLLARRALQRDPYVSRYSAFTRFWDPAGQATPDPRP